MKIDVDMDKLESEMKKKMSSEEIEFSQTAGRLLCDLNFCEEGFKNLETLKMVFEKCPELVCKANCAGVKDILKDAPDRIKEMANDINHLLHFLTEANNKLSRYSKLLCEFKKILKPNEEKPTSKTYVINEEMISDKIH